MTYTLTQEQIAEPQVVREGMCLADWEQVPGFSWDKLEDLDALANLILPPKIAALAAYDFDTGSDSPNYGGFGTTIQLPAKRAVLHWWGNPSGQNPRGIINWLCNPASQVSAHSVVWPGNVACIVAYNQPSWANGNTLANTTAVTLECDPNDIPGTISTLIEYLPDLVRQGVLAADFELTGHLDWYNTACPGGYYGRLAEIRQAVRDNLAGAPSTSPAPTPTPTPSKPTLPANFPLPFPLPAGHYYGNIAGPARSHGGYYAAEQPAVKALQQALIIAGCVPGVTNPASGWADGKYEQPTVDAAIRFQKRYRPNSTTRWGELWADDVETLRYLFA